MVHGAPPTPPSHPKVRVLSTQQALAYQRLRKYTPRNLFSVSDLTVQLGTQSFSTMVRHGGMTLIVLAALLLLSLKTCAFSSSIELRTSPNRRLSAFASPSFRNSRLSASGAGAEEDVSDLGLTLDDLNAPLPPEFFSGLETSGYESTSRLADVDDGGCAWSESSDEVEAVLTIPGLRGQPSACLALEVAETTVSVTAFGRVVWSCILRGECQPEGNGATVFEAEDGPGMVPVIRLSLPGLSRLVEEGLPSQLKSCCKFYYR
uniref:Transmembrane protein n=1 Tax=Odontella aurita TaxID=265563 RepID=A0A7S4J5G7_9STRA|mmetsp:Transcript_38977/g.117200  ORF Transcript_38977/g.117200 Transcript_38977/m.117200 type:complete len:262 (+) Transcript_38977:1-786(+)